MKNSAISDIKAAAQLSDYEAVEVLWVALVKLANQFRGADEHKRMLALLDTVPQDRIQATLRNPGVDALLSLNPPLETILVDPHERLNGPQTAVALQHVRDLRDRDPKAAMIELSHILKRIRNKRVHGFKTRDGSRDTEILGAARNILKELCEACI